MTRKSRPKGTDRFLQDVGTTIRLIRKEQGLLQEQLGARAGLAGSRIGEIERGDVDTSISRVKAIAEALEVPLSVLFKRLEFSQASEREIGQERQKLARQLGKLSAEQLEAVAKVVDVLGRKT